MILILSYELFPELKKWWSAKHADHSDRDLALDIKMRRVISAWC